MAKDHPEIPPGELFKIMREWDSEKYRKHRWQAKCIKELLKNKYKASMKDKSEETSKKAKNIDKTSE